MVKFHKDFCKTLLTNGWYMEPSAASAASAGRACYTLRYKNPPAYEDDISKGKLFFENKVEADFYLSLLLPALAAVSQ